MRAFFRRLARVRPTVWDTLFAVSLTAVTWAAGAYPFADAVPFDRWAYLLSAVVLLPFAARRSFTMSALLVSTLAYLVYLLAGYRMDLVWWGPVIGLYSVVAHRPRWMGAIGSLLVGAVVMYAGLIVAMVSLPVLIGQVTLILIAVWLIGSGARALADRGLRLTRMAEDLRREQDDRERRAVAEEQLRIARELHDVVAHHMSVISVQAGLARYVFDTDPSTARTAVETIADAGHEAQEEMRRLLRVLRLHSSSASGASGADLPGLARLDELADRIRGAGLPVEVAVTGPVRPLPVPIDTCVYRVVQESLTNALKHAGPATATVTVEYSDAEVRATIADDGRSQPAPGSGQFGYGLIGMRERVRLYGGTLTAGPRPEGGYRVVVTVPL